MKEYERQCQNTKTLGKMNENCGLKGFMSSELMLWLNEKELKSKVNCWVQERGKEDESEGVDLDHLLLRCQMPCSFLTNFVKGKTDMPKPGTQQMLWCNYFFKTQLCSILQCFQARKNSTSDYPISHSFWHFFHQTMRMQNTFLLVIVSLIALKYIKV